jgi:hypothetical protein
MSRTRSERMEAALGRLATEANVWLATASPAGVPHLVPLSLAWIDGAIVVATPTSSATVRNATSSGRVRLSLDSADDVVIIDTTAAASDTVDVEPALLARYVERVGWDPRNEQGSWSLLSLTPTRVQAWNGVNEIDDRTIMREGVWLTD